VVLPADIAVGAFEFPLKAFALSRVKAVSSRALLSGANPCLFSFESSGFDACEFATSNPLMDAHMLAALLLVKRLCRSSNR
jgi:hypothetical protein